MTQQQIIPAEEETALTLPNVDVKGDNLRNSLIACGGLLFIWWWLKKRKKSKKRGRKR